ncbi:hypothetical protein SHIRM173S_09671 [Streptomyces hirsutus]
MRPPTRPPTEPRRPSGAFRCLQGPPTRAGRPFSRLLLAAQTVLASVLGRQVVLEVPSAVPFRHRVTAFLHRFGSFSRPAGRPAVDAEADDAYKYLIMPVRLSG